MQLNLLHENNEQALKEELKKTQREVTSAHPISVRVLDHVFESVFAHARQSLGFHSETQSPNIYKEAGHLCFWICKHKPFRHNPHPTKIAWAKMVSTFGQENAADLMAKRMKALRQMPVNEIIALKFAVEAVSKTSVIQAHEDLQSKSCTRDQYNARLENIKSNTMRFNKRKVAKTSSSFHVHTYSARSTAMLFECYFE